MNESQNKYYVNGKVFKCNLKEPILLIQSFLNKMILQSLILQ